MAKSKRRQNDGGKAKSDPIIAGDGAKANGECNPCFEESAGILTCDGVNPVVIPNPPDDGVEYVLSVRNGVVRWKNAAPVAESAPAPRPANGPSAGMPTPD